jgi:hypothetical protein
MKLNRVTITGADNSIDPKELAVLSERFHWVEWGILFSPNKQGQSRYPSMDWVESLAKVKEDSPQMALSGHLCGGWVQDIVAGNYAFRRDFGGFFRHLDRIQMNMTDTMFMALDLRAIQELVIHPAQIILQTKRFFQRADDIRAVNASGGTQFSMLYDVSGGKGRLPGGWCTPAEDIYCGYAGGLSPDNVEAQLQKIETFVGQQPIWIDMESKVRLEVDDSFSLNKVTKVLETVSPWVNRV